MKKNEKKKAHAFFSVREIPLSEREMIEITRVGEERRLVLNGVRRILQYDAACMIFLLRRERLEVHGQGLCCSFFVSGAVGVLGKVTCLCFAEEGK